MEIKKIADLAENFEHESAGTIPLFTSRFEHLMRAPSQLLVSHPDAKHVLVSELDALLESSHKSPALNELVRLVKAALSMFAWAERARNNKRRSEELAAIEAAVSAIDAVKKMYKKLKGNP